MAIIIVTVIAVALAALGLTVQPTRRFIGVLLLCGGILISLTGVGMVLGIPIAVVGTLILYIEYAGKRRLRHPHHPHRP